MQIAVLFFGFLVGVALYLFFVEPLWLLPALERATPGILYRVKTSVPIIGLSFDDGPDPRFTPQILEILAAHDANATFFLIGERALRQPNLVERIRTAGHEIGNHYFQNGTTLWHSNAEFARALEETEKAIGDLKPLRLFRPPGGVAWPWQVQLARARGYECVLGCAYPHDPMRPPVRYMRWLIEKNLRPGTIVILHDGISDATRSVEVLPEILEAGRKRGLSFVTIGALMDRKSHESERGSAR